MTAQTHTPAGSPPSRPGAGDTRPLLFGALDWYTELLAGTPDDLMSAPTPCTEFDVRMLLTHLSVVVEKIDAFARDHRDPYADHDRSAEAMRAELESLARQRVDGLTPAQRAERAREAVAAVREAWTEEVLDTPIHLGWGPVLPGRIVAGIYTMEMLSHGWDLATATGQPSEAPGEVAEAGLVFAKQGLPAEPRGEENGLPFGPVVPSAPDAGPTERLANWTGRVSR